MAETLHERSERLLQARIKNLKPGQQKFNFVFLGDSRGTSTNCFLSGEFEVVLKRAVQRNPLFIVHGGDTVFTGNRDALTHFVEVVEKIAPTIPVFVCVGNHDELFINKSNLANFRATIGKVHWVINVPQFHYRCIALNNVVNPGGPGIPAKYGFTNSELTYLENQLKISPRNTVLAMHTQPAIGRWTKLDGFPVNTQNSKRFFHLLLKNQEKVKRVLVSHVHAYDEEFIKGNGVVSSGRGTNFVVSGGAGAPLEPTPLIYNNFHFTEFSVTKFRVSSPDLWRVFGTPTKPCL